MVIIYEKTAHSLSHREYATLGAKFESTYLIEMLLCIYSNTEFEELPNLVNLAGTPYPWDKSANLKESKNGGTQEIFINSFQKSYAGKYSFDTHNKTTFLKNDLRPDIVMSRDNTETILGEQ